MCCCAALVAALAAQCDGVHARAVQTARRGMFVASRAEYLINVIDDFVSADNPQEQLQRFTKALYEACARGQSMKHMIQR